MEKKKIHKSVLLQEVIRLLDPKPGQVYIDATVGFGGHTEAILKKIGPYGKLLGLDQDIGALNWSGANLQARYSNLTLEKANFSEVGKIAQEKGFMKANGILADIGVSSIQLDEPERGFSFKNTGPLDMRMDQSREVTAADILARYSEQQLADILSRYGEERLSKTIAAKIVQRRKKNPFKETVQLAELVRDIYHAKSIKIGKIHPATKVFQALRIEVNDELGHLEKFLPQAVDLLVTKGRLAVITFHSLEDRIVKDFFQQEAKGCICPPEFPTCKCNHKKRLKIVTRKPIVASSEEILENPRARSAKLRVVIKL